MSKNIMDILAASGANINITMTAEELRSFAQDLANKVAEHLSHLTVDAIKSAMGDTMKYCTTEEAIEEYGIPQSTLNSWIAKGYLHPLKKGRKNVYLREELNEICLKK